MVMRRPVLIGEAIRRGGGVQTPTCLQAHQLDLHIMFEKILVTPHCALDHDSAQC